MFKLAIACFISALFHFFTHSSGTNNTTAICPTYQCKNGPKISYPFWLSQGSPPDQYCGYHDLGLICLDHGDTIFAPLGLYYYVKDIDYENRSLKLVDFDTVNQTCPRALHNVPLGNLPLTHSPLNLNLPFYYNCSNYPSEYNDVSSIECLKSGANESFVFETENANEGFDWSGNCAEKVVVTVMKDQVTSEGLVNEFAGAMSEGFVLDWQTASNCAECEASGGLCGYNNTRKELLCFCKDGSTRTNDCKGTLAGSIVLLRRWNQLTK